MNASRSKSPKQYLVLNLAERNSPRAEPRSSPQQNLVERDSPRVMLNLTLHQCLLKIDRFAHSEHPVLSKSLAEPSSPRQLMKTKHSFLTFLNLNQSREARPVQTVGISPILANLILSLVAVFSAHRSPAFHIGNKVMTTTSFRPRTSCPVPNNLARESRMSREPRQTIFLFRPAKLEQKGKCSLINLQHEWSPEWSNLIPLLTNPSKRRKLRRLANKRPAAYARAQRSPTGVERHATQILAPPIRARPCRRGKTKPKLTEISGGPHRSAKGLITWKVTSRFDLND